MSVTLDRKKVEGWIFDPHNECMPRRELRQVQLARLQSQTARAEQSLPYYAKKMKAAGITAGHVKTLDDLRNLPFTTKEDLRHGYPFGTFASPLKDVVRLHASTGTTGKPTVVGYTRADMEVWTQVVARFLAAAGLNDEDIVQIAFGYGLFTGGFGLHYGCERIGATVIPASSGNTERQIMLMQDLGTTALVCTPSYAVYLGESFGKMGITQADHKLRVGFFGGEFWSEGIRRKIEESLGILATDNYGLSEIIGPGVSGECHHQKGMHICEDHFLVEIIDPNTLQPVPEGGRGEVVITTLSKEANPVIRYRTRDISRLIPEECECGRTHRRMEKVTGRTDDMIIIRGVNIFPSQIEHVLLQFKETEPHYLLVVSRENEMDTLEVRVEISPNLFSDKMTQLDTLRKELQRKIESLLGIRVKLSLVEPGSLERFMGKAKRVLDTRNA